MSCCVSFNQKTACYSLKWFCYFGYVFKNKIKSFGITKDYGFVYGSASGQVILSFLQRLLVYRLARAAGYPSTLTGNIESGQNVSWPVITRVNIGDDAALLRRIDVSITSFDNPMICGEILFESWGKQISASDKSRQYWRRCSALTSHRRQYYVVW